MFRKIWNKLKNFFIKTKEITMREAIKGEIKSLLSNKDNPVCILLKGNWGIGKTHLWKEIEKELKEKNNEKTLIAYVSLFGKENIAQIEQEVKSQISIMQELKDKFENMGVKTLLDKTTLIGGSSVNGILSIFGNEIKNAIICFDDFERHSKNLEFKDILGEISILKENNNCNILMIMNEDDLKNKKEDKEIFDKYKEKIVDFEFAYEPTPQDSLEIIKNDFDTFKDFALTYFKSNPKYLDMTINNIRIMKKIANAVKYISKNIPNIDKLKYEIKKDFFDTICNVIIDDYYEKQHYSVGKQHILNYLEAKREIHSLYFSNDFKNLIKWYMQNNLYTNHLKLNKEIEIATEKYNKIEKNNEMKRLQINLEAFSLYYENDFPLDFTNDYKWAINKISEFLHNKYFIDVVEYDKGLRWLNKLGILENKLNMTNKHNELKLKLLKEYCKINKQDEKALSIIINFDKSNSQILYDEITKDNIDNVIEFNTVEKLCEYLNITGKNDEYSMLKFIDTNKLKDFFTQSIDAVRICVNEIEKHTKFEEMNKFKEKIIEVLGNIATDNKLEKFQNEKAKKILENLKNKQLNNESLKTKIENILKEINKNIDNN